MRLQPTFSLKQIVNEREKELKRTIRKHMKIHDRQLQLGVEMVNYLPLAFVPQESHLGNFAHYQEEVEERRRLIREERESFASCPHSKSLLITLLFQWPSAEGSNRT